MEDHSEMTRPLEVWLLILLYSDSLTDVIANNHDELLLPTIRNKGVTSILLIHTIGLSRGYTGHEMMPEFGLVNMNGRLYDPALGRFLSPDNYVQEPDNSQSFNRYSYCLNNPLKYTDPSGEAFWIPAIIVLSGVVNAALNSDNIHNWIQTISRKASERLSQLVFRTIKLYRQIVKWKYAIIS